MEFQNIQNSDQNIQNSNQDFDNLKKYENKEIELNYSAFYNEYFNDINFFNSFIIKNDVDKEICIKKLYILIQSLNEMELLMFIYSINNSQTISYIYELLLKDLKNIALLINIISKKIKIKLKKKDGITEYKLPYKHLEKAIKKQLENKDISPDLRYYLLQLNVFVKKAQQGALCNLNDLECKMYYLQEAVENGKEEIIDEIKKININPQEIIDEIKKNLNVVENEIINKDTDSETVNKEIDFNPVFEKLDLINNIIDYQKSETEIIKDEIFSLKEKLDNLNINNDNNTVDDLKEKIFEISEKLENFKNNENNEFNPEMIEAGLSEAVKPLEMKINDLETKILPVVEMIEKLNKIVEVLNEDTIKEFIEKEFKAIEMLESKLKGEEK